MGVKFQFGDRAKPELGAGTNPPPTASQQLPLTPVQHHVKHGRLPSPSAFARQRRSRISSRTTRRSQCTPIEAKPVPVCSFGSHRPPPRTKEEGIRICGRGSKWGLRARDYDNRDRRNRSNNVWQRVEVRMTPQKKGRDVLFTILQQNAARPTCS